MAKAKKKVKVKEKKRKFHQVNMKQNQYFAHQKGHSEKTELTQVADVLDGLKDQSMVVSIVERKDNT